MTPPFKQLEDGTILNPDGKVLMFSIERFKSDIIDGDKCFICGADPQEKEFNGEHILPDWILREFKIHNRYITLPNLSKFKYSEYKVPCCKDCNSTMGNHFEIPISAAIKKGMNALTELLEENGVEYLFNWLALIFIKTHLKDISLRHERDQRKMDHDTIADKFYDFETLHHIHCIARSFYTKALWDHGVMVTFPPKSVPVEG